MEQISNTSIYYDNDAKIDYLDNKRIGVIGYGIQGRAMSLNLRDSKLNIRVANRKDNYYDTAINDGFDVMNPEELSNWADIILYLIPDDVQIQKYSSWIEPYLTEGKSIVFAHGYAVYYKKIILKNNIDILLLAPRMPGRYIRDRFLRGWGTPVFIDAYQDYTGNAKNTVLALAKSIGATKVGAMEINLEEETEIDLFVEQFILSSITNTIHMAFDYLVSKGFTPEAVISELYASKEIGKLLTDAGDSNIYKIFIDNASPTCQTGKMRNMNRPNEMLPIKHMDLVLKEIRENIFYRYLDKEGQDGYKNLKNYNKDIENTYIVKTHARYNKMHLSESDGS